MHDWCGQTPPNADGRWHRSRVVRNAVFYVLPSSHTVTADVVPGDSCRFLLTVGASLQLLLMPPMILMLMPYYRNIRQKSETQTGTRHLGEEFHAIVEPGSNLYQSVSVHLPVVGLEIAIVSGSQSGIEIDVVFCRHHRPHHQTSVDRLIGVEIGFVTLNWIAIGSVTGADVAPVQEQPLPLYPVRKSVAVFCLLIGIWIGTGVVMSSAIVVGWVTGADVFVREQPLSLF